MSAEFKLIQPRIIPPLDPEFRPAVLATKAFGDEVAAAGKGVPLQIRSMLSEYSSFSFGSEVAGEYTLVAPNGLGNISKTLIQRPVYAHSIIGLWVMMCTRGDSP
jgi:hypothetical protein